MQRDNVGNAVRRVGTMLAKSHDFTLKEMKKVRRARALLKEGRGGSINPADLGALSVVLYDFIQDHP